MKSKQLGLFIVYNTPIYKNVSLVSHKVYQFVHVNTM